MNESGQRSVLVGSAIHEVLYMVHSKDAMLPKIEVFFFIKSVFQVLILLFLHLYDFMPGLARSGNVLSSSCCVTNRRLATTKRWCSLWILLWFFGGVPPGSFHGCMQLLAFVLLCNGFYRDCRVHLTSNKALSIHRVC